MWRTLLSLAALLCLAHLAAAQTSVASAQQALLKLPVPEMETEVPAPVQTGIVALKHALVDQTDTVLSVASTHTTAAEVQRALAGTLPKEQAGIRSDADMVAIGNRKHSDPIPGMYGGGLHSEVTQPRPGLLFVVERFNIQCGSDSVLLVYQAKQSRWQRILWWDSGKYAQVSGAFGDTYETRILTPTRDGRPLLLVLHGTPWCTSTESSFAMDVFELGATGDRPIWHGSHSYRRADLEPPLTLKTTADGFEVRTSVDTLALSEQNGGQVSRKGIMRYVVKDGTVHRVEPLATNALGTLEEWLQMPRDEAHEFADEGARSQTWQMYETLTWRGVKEADINRHWSANYGAVHACHDTAKHFQTEITTSRGYGPKEEHGKTYYVQIREVPNGYRIHAVTETPDATCNGSDLMATP